MIVAGAGGALVAGGAVAWAAYKLYKWVCNLFYVLQMRLEVLIDGRIINLHRLYHAVPHNINN